MHSTNNNYLSWDTTLQGGEVVCKVEGIRPHLSPAAQAVLDAFAADNYGVWLRGDPDSLAAALRAVADQVVPEEPLYGGDQRWIFERDARQTCRKKLLAIAAELEGFDG